MVNKNKISSSTTKHIVYFDRLRIAAIIAIVVLHSASQNWYAVDITSPTWNTFNIYDSLMRWGVPVFVMISGALFLSKEQSIKKIYKKNIIKLLIILIIWTLIYTIWQFSLPNNQFSFKEFMISLFTGPYYLWFLYMLMGLYMLVPLLKKITENKKLMQYFLLLAFIFAFLIPELTEIIAFKSEIAASLIEDKMSKMKLFMVLGFTGYFVLGHYLNTKIIKGKSEIFIYLTGILGVIFTILLTSLSSNLKSEANSFFYDNMTINVAAMSIAVFVFFKNHINFKCRTPRREKLLRLFSRCSLGVYLIHLIILGSLDLLFGINSLSFNPIISVPILSLLVLAISYPISILLYKIPVIGKKIV